MSNLEFCTFVCRGSFCPTRGALQERRRGKACTSVGTGAWQGGLDRIKSAGTRARVRPPTKTHVGHQRGSPMKGSIARASTIPATRKLALIARLKELSLSGAPSLPPHVRAGLWEQSEVPQAGRHTLTAATRPRRGQAAPPQRGEFHR